MICHIKVLTDCDELGTVIYDQLVGFGYEIRISNTIAEFQKNVKATQKYLLIVDYLLSEGDCRELLNDLLTTNAAPSGLLVMSELPGFESFLNEVADRYAECDVPFLFLEKPFESSELRELLQRLSLGLREPLESCLRQFKYNVYEIGSIGGMLRAARENLGLERSTVASVAQKKEISITEKRLEEIEADRFGANTGCRELVVLSQLLYVSTRSHDKGFEPWAQLRRVEDALIEETYPFPINFTLRSGLLELAQRNKIEKHYADVVLFRQIR